MCQLSFKIRFWPPTYFFYLVDWIISLLRFSQILGLDARIEHFRSPIWILRQILRIYLSSEVYKAEWR